MARTKSTMVNMIGLQKMKILISDTKEKQHPMFSQKTLEPEACKGNDFHTTKDTGEPQKDSVKGSPVEGLL